MCIRATGGRGLIFPLYLSSLSGKLLYMHNQNVDMGSTLQVSDWALMAETTAKMSINMALVEASWKTLLRWYLVPIKISHTFLKARTWLKCLNIHRFFTLISNVFCQTLVSTLIKILSKLLNALIPDISRGTKRLIYFIFWWPRYLQPLVGKLCQCPQIQ